MDNVVDKPTADNAELRRFEALAKSLVAVPNAEVQAALTKEKRAEAERKRTKA